MLPGRGSLRMGYRWPRRDPSTHEGQSATIDLERFAVPQPTTEAAQGQLDARVLAMATSAEQISARLADASARWSSDEYRDAFV